MMRLAAIVLAGSVYFAETPGHAQSAETVFKDPRGRYTLSHDKDWKVLLNFTGMPSFFCNWEGCDKSPQAGCIFVAIGMDLPDRIPEDEFELVLLSAANSYVQDPTNALFNGKAVTATQVVLIGKQKWAAVDVEAAALGTKTTGAMWLTLNHRVLISVACKALPVKWPEYRTKFLRVLESVRMDE